jgi:hypothetical protein
MVEHVVIVVVAPLLTAAMGYMGMEPHIIVSNDGAGAGGVHAVNDEMMMAVAGCWSLVSVSASVGCDGIRAICVVFVVGEYESVVVVDTLRVDVAGCCCGCSISDRIKDAA